MSDMHDMFAALLLSMTALLIPMAWIGVAIALTFNDPAIQPIAVNGKPLKSANQWMNKAVARLRSQLGFGTSRQVQNICRNRNNFVQSTCPA